MQNFEKENEADFCQENLVELSPIFNSENKLGESLGPSHFSQNHF